MNDAISCEIKKEAPTHFNKKDLYCLYCQTALLHNIHNTSHLLTVQHAIMFFLFDNNNNNNNNNKKDDYIYVHNSVTSSIHHLLSR